MERKIIRIKNLKKSFGKVKVLDNINLEINKGDFISFFGPNGSGKTTLMNLIAGIDKANSGKIISDELSVGYIFQDFRESLLPWKRVWENIAFPLFVKGISKKKAYQRVKKLVSGAKIQLDLNAYPFMLSGGQAQMVQILRALIIKPDILIFDEPFSALDYVNHLDLIMKIRKLYEKNKFTVLFVSHDIDEAILLGNKVVFFSNKPTKILEILDCNLPRLRKIDLMTSKKFSKIKSKALKIIQPSAIPHRTLK